mgnify:CR=1 FL=1
MKYAEMRGQMNMAESIQMEMEELMRGQMVNMYEVHVRDLAQYTPEKMEELRMDVSKKLGFAEEEEVEGEMNDMEQFAKVRLMAVMQAPEVCTITRDLWKQNLT